MIFCTYRDNTRAVTMGNYSADRPIIHKPSSFITDVLCNLRQRKIEYIFSEDQIGAIKARLKPNERLSMTESDGIYTISLTKGE